MKVVVLNGSPRKGNTLAAIEALVKGMALGSAPEVEIVDTYKLTVAPCKGCGACQCFKGCVDQDDTNMIVDKLVAADVIVFATPVYWWGMTAQLKLVLDKCYCRGAQLKGKKIGLIVVGGSDVENVQYELIHRQFQCIEEYLDWKMMFFEKFSATKKDELAQNPTAIDQMVATGKSI